MNTTVKSFFNAFLIIAILSVGTESIALSKTKVVKIATSAVCSKCKARIEKALLSAEGVEAAILNLNNKEVKVKYDPVKTSPEKIRTVISNTGYNADDVHANETAYHNLPSCCQKPGVCVH